MPKASPAQPARRSTERGAATRARILEAAASLFGDLGFASVTMRAIGDAAEIDGSSIYRHFLSKSALANAVIDAAVAPIGEALAASGVGHRDPSIEALEDACVSVGGHLFDHPVSARLVLQWVVTSAVATARSDVEIQRGPGRPAGEALAAGLAAAAAQGAIRSHEVPDALVILLGMVLLRPATRGQLLAGVEPKRSDSAARDAFLGELRVAVRGAFVAS